MKKIIILLSLLGTVLPFVDSQAATVEYVCPNGFTNHGSSCYYYNTNSLSWDNAEAACVALGFHLAEIETESENIVVSDLTSNTLYVWFGAKDTHENDSFYYTDGTSLDGEGVYTNWLLSFPSTTGSYDCAQFVDGGYWRGDYCMELRNSVCEAGPTSGPTLVCFDGWETNPDDIEGLNACYKFVTTPVTFETAISTCQREGGNVFRAVSQAEQDFVYNKIKDHFWIDATDLDTYSTEGTFVASTFTNTTQLLPITWKSGEPNDKDGNEDCTIIFKCDWLGWLSGKPSGKANDVNCVDLYSYACKSTAT